MPGFSRVKAAYGRSWVIDPQNLVDNHPALACCDAAWHAPIMSILEMLHARLTARKIGQDRFGNIYYEARKTLPVYNRKRRYVVTAHGQDPTKVPAEWHAWLHHTTDAEGRKRPPLFVRDIASRRTPHLHEPNLLSRALLRLPLREPRRTR